MNALTVRAPAKINWFLSVLGRRPDGYHEISSAMQLVGLSDEIEIEDDDGLSLVSEMDIPQSVNLAYRAAALLRERTGFRGGAKLTLRKRTPSAAGLGGGSSDAAAALAGLNRFWGLGLGTDRLMRIAAEIGSDVPFFLNGPFACVSGRGELVQPAPASGPYPLLLVKPDIGVSTAWAYGALKKLTKKPIDIKLFCHALDRGDFDLLQSMTANDLEEPVVRSYPVVGEIRRALTESGALFAAMSGSGPTLFGVFGSRAEAERAEAAFGGHWRQVTETLSAWRSP